MNSDPANRLPRVSVHNLVLGGAQEPLIFKQYLSGGSTAWECTNYDMDQWLLRLQHKQLKLRMGLRQHTSVEPQWESYCSTAYLTFKQLVEWSTNGTECETTHGEKVTSDSHFAYYDYVHVQHEADMDFLKSQISWDAFGFPGRDSYDSTIWIGTAGANTSCHMDTYGCNLVAQIFGTKRWTLFPPDQSKYLYPTRLPYEESSIYSQVDFTNINVEKYPDIKMSTPTVVTLHPGDVLLVPKHWWHFVENLEFSISVNTWVELPSDNYDKLKEALVQHQVASVCQSIESTNVIKKLLNPNMIHVATMSSQEIFECLEERIKGFFEPCESGNATVVLEKEIGDESQKHKARSCDESNKFIVHNIAKPRPDTFQEYMKVMASEHPPRKAGCDQKSSLHDMMLQSLTDPRVVDLLAQVLLEKLNSASSVV